MKWYLKQLAAIGFIIFVSVFCLLLAYGQTRNTSDGNIVFALAFLSGLVPIMVEFFIALKNGTLFIRDRAKVKARQASNKKLARQLLPAGILFAIAIVYSPDLFSGIVMGAMSGYLVPYAFFLLIHFIKNHKEIKHIDTGK